MDAVAHLIRITKEDEAMFGDSHGRPGQDPLPQ